MGNGIKTKSNGSNGGATSMAKEKDAAATPPTCFVIMPVSDPDGYVKGHFKHVYDDILVPACDKAGFKAIRADQVKQSNLIHLDILQKLLDAPMAVCDLSNRNPNVLFELALRQAFDKPVALVQEIGTQQIFDIAPLRYTQYHKERIYHEVLEDQKEIGISIQETYKEHAAGTGINSIVKLLALGKPAAIPEVKGAEASADMLKVMMAEFSQLRMELRNNRRPAARPDSRGVFLDDLRDRISIAERLVLSPSDPGDIERGEAAVSNCIALFRHLSGTSENDSDRRRLLECELKIDVLSKCLDEKTKLRIRKPT
jgi:hypothetical protein